jgi:two-component sensor histidine kinase
LDLAGATIKEMKIVYTTTLLAFLLLSSGGVLLWWDYASSSKFEAFPQAAVYQIKSNFESKNKPLFTINNEEIRQSKESKELIDPRVVLPHTQKYPFKEMAAIFKYAESCKGPLPKHLSDVDLIKTLKWHEYVCGRRKNLGEDFFKTRPFMHPSGKSFVALAVKLGRGVFKDPSWVSSHLRFEHILESPNRFTSLSLENFANLLGGDPIVEAKSYVFLMHKNEISMGPGTVYSAYGKETWDKFLSHQFFIIRKGTGPDCVLEEGGLCWAQNKARSANESLHLALIFTAGLLLLAGTLLGQIIRKSISQKRAANQRTFVLQMLTHEIRTPATSLRLSLETLRSEFDRLPTESQKAFLRICDQTEKLVSVIEASKQYLIQENTDRSVKLKTQTISSLNSFFETITEKYGPKISLKNLSVDRSANFDRYWIELCLHNLIDNALAHGKGPVNVALSQMDDELVIDVQDQGILKTKSLDDLATPFQKGELSQGLGLGLTLVRKITQSMGGELTLKDEPTTFSIKLRDLT